MHWDPESCFMYSKKQRRNSTFLIVRPFFFFFNLLQPLGTPSGNYLVIVFEKMNLDDLLNSSDK